MFLFFEFERFCVGGKEFVAPFDFEGIVLEAPDDDLAAKLAGWLMFYLDSLIFMGSSIPEASSGNRPQRGGDILVLGVDVDRTAPQRMRGADAARLLGVSPGRITQMWYSGELVAYKEGRKLWVSEKSVIKRKRSGVRPGRPRKDQSNAARNGSLPALIPRCCR